MPSDRRTFLRWSSVAAIGGLAGCNLFQQEETPAETPADTPTESPTDVPPGTPTATETETETETEEETDTPAPSQMGQDVTVRQESGNLFYWVLPGERRLSPAVFGTPDSPQYGRSWLEQNIERARQFPDPLGEAIPQLLQDLPFLVAAPEGARESVDDPVAQQKLAEPTLYSDEAQVASGEFEVTYMDRQPWDTGGPPGKTDASAELSTAFTDPAGNEYELELDHIVKPPIPGYETGGGVITDAWHHGSGLPGSPLMPGLYTYGAMWGVGDVVVNGEVATEDGFRVIHFMTTQTVRDQDYRLPVDEELPLMPDETIAGQAHHTHGVVLPIKPTADGPVFDPVPTAFELPNGETQPFIHAMWEQEEIGGAPFTDWTPQ